MRTLIPNAAYETATDTQPNVAYTTAMDTQPNVAYTAAMDTQRNVAYTITNCKHNPVAKLSTAADLQYI